MHQNVSENRYSSQKTNEPKQSNGKKLCEGRCKNETLCKNYATGDHKVCKKSHWEMRNYTKEQLESTKRCTECKMHRLISTGSSQCIHCIEKQENIKTVEGEEDDKNPNELCKGLTKDGKKCEKALYDNTRFCKEHQELVHYTQNMLDNQKYCSTGRHYVYCGTYATCENCRNTNKMYYEEKKERNKHSNHKKCLLCTEDSRKEYGDYCWNHRTTYIRTEAAKQNKKVCNGGNRACIELLPHDYKHEKCEKCRKKFNEYDNARYKKKQEKVDKSRENSENSLCIRCGEIQKLANFQIKSGELSRYCSSCRLKSCIYDKSRIRRNVKTNEKLIKSFIRNAQPHRRAKKWKLTMEEALDIISNPCYYCGTYDEKMNDNGKLYSNIGIDRVDNKKGYTTDNVVPACRLCNYMKYTYSSEKFVEYCMNIWKYTGSMTKKSRSCRPYSQYKYDAKKRNIPFKIDHNTFDKIIANDCFYCDGRNNSYQIGIDRIDSSLPYCIKINQLVAACRICNQMKKDYTFDTFYNHISKILLFNKKITENEYNKKQKLCENTEVAQLITDLRKAMNNFMIDNMETLNSASDVDKKYVECVWKSFNCSTITPNIIVCETNDEIKEWNIYRNMLCIKESKTKGSKILITDKSSGKCIGIMELSIADLVLMESLIIKNYFCTPYDALSKNIKNIVLVNFCEPMQPFGHNFSGKSLLLKTLFSEEMYNIIRQKMNKQYIYGFICFSSEKDMIHHYNIDEFECIGYDPSINDKKLDIDILKRVTNYLKSHQIPIKYSYGDNLQIFRKYLDINNTFRDDGQNWIHFGYTNKNWMQYFRSMDHTRIGEYLPKLYGIEHVTKEWLNNYALRKFNDHCVLDTFEIYSNIDDVHNEEVARKIIKYWFQNQDQSFCKISVKASLKLNQIIDEEFVKSLIIGNVANLCINEDHSQLMKKYKYYSVDKCHDKFCGRLTRLDEIDDNELVIDIKNDKFNIYTDGHQNDFIPIDCITYKKKNMVINNFVIGKWKVIKSRFDEPNILFEMYSINNHEKIREDKDGYDNIESHILNNNDHFIQCIALSESDEDYVTINDPRLHSHVYKFMQDKMIHIKSNQNTKIIRILQQSDKSGKICGIKIIDETPFGFSDSDHSDCWCNFKGVFIMKTLK